MKTDTVTSDDIKIYYTVKFKDFAAKYIIKTTLYFNFLPNDVSLDQTELKAVAGEKINVTQQLKFAFGRIENIVGNGENDGNQHFLLLPQYFQELSFPWLLNVDIVGV